MPDIPQDETQAFEPPAEHPRRRVARKLTVVARQMVQRFDQSVEQIGVSRAKFGIIALVSRHPGATQRTIAERLEVTEVTAGRLIERLCADGYLERRENSTDRRALSIYLAPNAQPMLEQLAALATAQEKEAFAGFADEDIEKLDALLGALARNIANARAQS